MRIGRTVPPVGVRIPVRALFGAISDTVSNRDGAQAFLEAVADHYRVRKAFGVSSGKAALTVILGALSALSPRRQVILPAYTCYSVPSAIVRAGLEPVPCDVDADTFDYDYAKLLPLLGGGTLSVVSVHLFGVPSDTERLMEVCTERGVFVVEDAAQAMGGVVKGRSLGTIGDVAFFSMGRGKNITCGSGGLILSNSDRISAEIAKIRDSLPAGRFTDDLQVFLTLLSQDVFIAPCLYWIPSGIPLLRLGETVFDTDFPMRRLTDYQTAILSGWQDTLTALADVRRANARFYLANVPGARGYGADVAYLRFPVVLSPAAKWRILGGRNVSNLGISGMYPSPVSKIPRLMGRLGGGAFPVAERLAESLVTLPTHPLVSSPDRERVCEAIARATALEEERVYAG
jgi:perosamine synthetase